jgi:hypothetical protein
MGGQVRQAAGDIRPKTENESRAEAQKHHDGRDFDGGEPVFRLAPGSDREQIQEREPEDEAQGKAPGRHPGEPVDQQPRPGHRFERDHDDPEVPIHPAGEKPCELAERQPVVFIETADGGVGGRHLSQHSHHQHDQHAGERK